MTIVVLRCLKHSLSWTSSCLKLAEKKFGWINCPELLGSAIVTGNNLYNTVAKSLAKWMFEKFDFYICTFLATANATSFGVDRNIFLASSNVKPRSRFPLTFSSSSSICSLPSLNWLKKNTHFWLFEGKTEILQDFFMIFWRTKWKTACFDHGEKTKLKGISQKDLTLKLNTEKRGFEPLRSLTTPNGFQDRRIQPLCHFSLEIVEKKSVRFRPLSHLSTIN